jgi:hypothetical protein
MLKAPQVRRADRTSKSKVAHTIQIRHRDEVEAPLTDWLGEAYVLAHALSSKPDTIRAKSTTKPGPKQNKAKVARKGVATTAKRR